MGNVFVFAQKKNAAQTPNVQAHNDSSVAGDPEEITNAGGGLESSDTHLYHWG